MNDTDTAFEDITKSVSRLPARMFSALGITINLRKLYRDRAARYNWQRKSRKISINRVMRDHISEDEKRLILLSAVLDKGRIA